MAKHQLTGNDGEEMAARWLQQKGFILLERNWRHSHYEVDIIASNENVLHFIEVKTRRSTTFGTPEESVDQKKIMNLLKASEEYQHQHPEWKRIQFDVLSITIDQQNSIEYFFIEDVYL